MAKRIYIKPIIYRESEFTPMPTPTATTISHGGSQGTSGYDSIFSFEDEDLEALIGDWSDEELAELDTDENGVITWEEYNNA